ncbi:hypothetical protein GCM10009623_30850 [Nocardioides aestuarii]|uniref:Uncharacterized protein n=1 Tax=Nocardioides aestuarii TaxID=252231 RepID=A0ABW4TNV0_9ACTN
MKFDLLPPREVAGVALGSPRGVARDRCARLGDPEEFRRGGEGTPSLVVRRPSGLALFVYFDSDDRVEAIEIGRPDSDEDLVVYSGHDVFAASAEELIQVLRADHVVEVDEEGRAVTLPDLLVAFWRPTLPEGPDDVEGRYFESVLVARPGYYE